MRIKYSIDEFLFFSAWILFSSSLILMSTIVYVNNPTFEYALKVIRYIAYAFCFAKIIRNQYTYYKLIAILMLVIFFVLSGVNTGNLTYPLYCFIVIASLDIENEKIIKLTAKIQGFYLIVVILLSQLGIILDFVFDPQIRARHGLGFSWTTTAPILFFYFSLAIVYNNRNSISFGKLIILELICLWLFYMTDSKMAFLINTLFIVFIAYESRNKNRWKWISKYNCLYVILPFLLFATTLLVVNLYDWYKPTWALIDRLMSHRLGLSQNAYRQYGIHLLGQPIKWIGYDYKAVLLGTTEKYNYVDSSYLQIAFNNGVLFLLTVLSLYSCSIYKAIKNHDYYLVIIYVFILLISLTEPRLMNFAYNPFPLLALGRTSKNRACEEKCWSLRERKMNIMT